MDMVAIKPARGRRLVLPEGGTGLDGLGIAPGADLPADGAFVAPGVWLRKRLDEGDALPVTQAAIDAGARAQAAREKPAKPAAADGAPVKGDRA